MPRIRIEREGLDIALQLAKLGSAVQPALDKAMRDQVPAIVAEIQHAALTLNIVSLSAEGKRTKKRRTVASEGGLRAAMAAAADARFSAGQVTFFIDRERLPIGKEALPRLTAQKQWRHPVYGNTEKWVAQRGRAGWFARAVRKRANETIPPEIRQAIERLIK